MTKPTPTFYVFHGSDEFRLAETLDDFKSRLGPPDAVTLNTTYLAHRGLTLAKLHHVCDAIPFLAEKRLVIVGGALSGLITPQGQDRSPAQEELVEGLTVYLPHLPETTRLVFVDHKALPANHPILKLATKHERGYAKRFDPPDARELPRWVRNRGRQHGCEIELPVAEHIAAIVGTDLRLLDQEISKLAVYTNGERPINLADVDALVPYAKDAVIWELVDALSQRNGRTAAHALHSLLDAGEHPLKLLAMIARQFRLLIQVKDLKGKAVTQTDIAKALKLHPFPTRKLYNQATRFKAAQLATIHRHLMDTDVAIKSGEIEQELALDLLVAGLAAPESGPA